MQTRSKGDQGLYPLNLDLSRDFRKIRKALRKTMQEVEEATTLIEPGDCSLQNGEPSRRTSTQISHDARPPNLNGNQQGDNFQAQPVPPIPQPPFQNEERLQEFQEFHNAYQEGTPHFYAQGPMHGMGMHDLLHQMHQHRV